MDLLHAPFKDSTLFGGDLAKLQKANTEGANALTRLTVLLTAASSTAPSLMWAEAGATTTAGVS